jgi:hypothetical protein
MVYDVVFEAGAKMLEEREGVADRQKEDSYSGMTSQLCLFTIHRPI